MVDLFSPLFQLAIAALILAGSLFSLIAAIGLNRLPHVFTRMHASSKAGTVGSGLLLLAAGLHAGELSILFRALAGFLFFILTAPISAHLLARAAHEVGYRLHEKTVMDELRRDRPLE